MASKKAESQKIEIPALDIKTAVLRVVGDAPFICHAWSEKSKREMIAKQQKKASIGKEVRRPAVDFASCLYWLTEKPNFDGLTDEQAQEVLSKVLPVSKFGFPVTAFKSAAIDAGYQQKILDVKTTARGAFHFVGEFTEIEGTPTIREDTGVIGGRNRTSQVIYRAEFKTWATNLTVKYNAGAISLEQIANLLNVGGFSNGIGDWRPARDGTFGTFHVE